MKIHLRESLIFPVFLIFAILTYMFSSFEIWSQITYLYKTVGYDKTLPPNEVFVSMYHYPRAAIFLPIVVIHKLFNVDLNFLFNIYTTFFLVIAVYLQYLSARLLNLKDSSIVKLFFFLMVIPFYFVISQYMNGRLIYSFFGFSLLNYLLIKNDFKNKLLLFVLYMTSGLFCSVSSGSFLIFYSAMVIHLLFFKYKEKSWKLPCLLSLVFWLPQLLLCLYKNVSYFGYSFTKILKHGYGVNIGILLVIGVSIVLFIGVLRKVRFALETSSVLLSMSILGVVLSVLGKSIFLTQIPTFILIGFIFIIPLLKDKYRNSFLT